MKTIIRIPVCSKSNEMTYVKKARFLLSVFPGRSDCYGAGEGACVKKLLTESVASCHILGKKRVGRYLLRRDGRIGALAVDIDELNLYMAIEYCAGCEHYGLTAYIERSKSKGYHVWWFFTDLVLARKARLVANYILDECELLDRVEVFPKQDYLEPGRFGNYINLPEFGRDARHGRTVFLNPDTDYRPYRDQWSFLSSMARISEAQLDEIIDLNDVGKEPHAGQSQFKVDTGQEVGQSLATPVPAKHPRPVGTPGQNQRQQGVYRPQAMTSPEEDKENCFFAPPCLRRILMEGVAEGFRNESSFRLSILLYRTGIPRDLGWVILWHWNSKNRPPLSEEELERTFRQGYSGQYSSYGCRNLEVYCRESCPIHKYRRSKGWQ